MTRCLVVGTMVAALLVVSPGLSYAQKFSATLSGFEEIGGLGAGETGAILSEGKGTLALDLNKAAQTLTFKLTYSGLSSAVLFSHIHFGKVHVAGGIIVWFCGPAGSPAHQTCPASGTVTGTLTAADVQKIAGQNVPAGDFDALEDVLTSNTAYVNVHTTNFGAGEIRGQIHRGEQDDEE